MRLAITKSHRIGESVKRKAAKDELVIDWLTEEELEQLKRWQGPKKYYSAIQSIQYDDTGANIIVLKDVFSNDTSNMNIIRFDTVTELRSIMKLTHRIEGGDGIALTSADGLNSVSLPKSHQYTGRKTV